MQENTSAHPSAVESFYRDLRSATSPMHLQLEANPISSVVMLPTVTERQYLVYLSLMREVIRHAEQEVFPAISHIVTDTAGRHKLALIDEDIDYLTSRGLTAPAVRNYQPYNTASAPFALGYAYVTEGSTLGGRMILKHLQQAIGISDTQGGRFMAGYGAQTGVQWKALLDMIGSYAVSAGQQDEIIRGSVSCFSAIDHYFTSGLSEA